MFSKIVNTNFLSLNHWKSFLKQLKTYCSNDERTQYAVCYFNRRKLPLTDTLPAGKVTTGPLPHFNYYQDNMRFDFNITHGAQGAAYHLMLFATDYFVIVTIV